MYKNLKQMFLRQPCVILGILFNSVVQMVAFQPHAWAFAALSALWKQEIKVIDLPHPEGV